MWFTDYFFGPLCSSSDTTISNKNYNKWRQTQETLPTSYCRVLPPGDFNVMLFPSILRVSVEPFNEQINTTEQRTIIQKYDDWYIGH